MYKSIWILQFYSYFQLKLKKNNYINRKKLPHESIYNH